MGNAFLGGWLGISLEWIAITFPPQIVTNSSRTLVSPSELVADIFSWATSFLLAFPTSLGVVVPFFMYQFYPKDLSCSGTEFLLAFLI